MSLNANLVHAPRETFALGVTRKHWWQRCVTGVIARVVVFMGKSAFRHLYFLCRSGGF
jgi:hypothetical protein